MSEIYISNIFSLESLIVHKGVPSQFHAHNFGWYKLKKYDVAEVDKDTSPYKIRIRNKYGYINCYNVYLDFNQPFIVEEEFSCKVLNVGMNSSIGLLKINYLNEIQFFDIKYK